jgi:hypothetical protein
MIRYECKNAMRRKFTSEEGGMKYESEDVG